MSVSGDLKARHAALWQRAVRHPFIAELGLGTLPQEKFRRYFQQDYVFVNDLVTVTGLAISKAPGLEAARAMAGFQEVLLGAEDALFVQAFEALGVPEAEYRAASALPTTAALGDFLVRTASQGRFEHICCALYVTEGVYLDWCSRLQSEGASPGVPAYRQWIDIHGEEALGPFVSFLQGVVDATPAPLIESLGPVFERTLQYEVRFWDMAYSGESWE